MNFNALPNPTISIDENSGILSSDGTICNGYSVTLTVNGGTIYKWSSGEVTEKITKKPTVNTTYSVEVVDDNGCKTSTTKSITVNPLPNVATGSDVEHCGTGYITLSATPGSNGNTIRWYDTASNGSIVGSGNNLVEDFAETKTYYAESYSTTTGCAATQRKAIQGIVVTQAQITQGPQNSRICNNGNASFSVIASNAKSYQWEVLEAGTTVWVPISEAGGNPTYGGWNSSTLTLTSTPASENGNVYRCIVASSPCEDKISTEALLQVSNINVIPTVNNVICKGSFTGTINVQITNGIGNYAVTLKKQGVTKSTLNNISSIAEFTGLEAGTYSLEVTDEALCSKVVDNIEVLEPETPLTANIIAFSDPKCFGSKDGSISVQAENGWEHFTYEINGDNHGTNWLFDNLGDGTYSIKVTDQNGCSKTLEQTLTEPTKLVISKKSSVDPKCFGQNNGEIQLGATGGTKSYEFKVGELTQTDSLFTGIAAGTHKCLVFDANSCKDSVEVTLSQLDAVSYSLDRSDYNGFNIACFGGTDSIKIIPSGGKAPYTIDFDDSTSSLTAEGKSFINLNATKSYDFAIEDSLGCIVSNTVNLSQPDELSVTTNSTNATCFGLANGTVSVSVLGGVTPYEFILKNSKGVIVKQERGSSFADNTLPAEDYSIDIIDANSCSTSAAFSITEPPILEATISVADVTCFGDSNGSAMATVVGGTFPYTYQWFDESNNEVETSATLSNVEASDYTIRITDSNGCSGASGQQGHIEQVVTIHNPPSELTFTTDVTSVACNGGSTGVIKVEPYGGWGSYEFATNKNSFSTNDSFAGLTSGWYKIYVRDSKNCIDSTDVMVGEQTSLVIDNLSFTNVTCNGGNNGTVQVTVSGGVPDYRYYLGENEFSGSKNDLTAGDYSVTVKDANGCSTFENVTISQPSAINYTSEVQNSTCGSSNGYIMVNPSGGTGSLSVLWEYDGTVGNSLSDIKSGNYNFAISDGVGCSRTFSQSISDEGGPNINLSNIANPLCYNGSNGTASVEITSGTLPIKYKLYIDGIATDSVDINLLPFTKTYNNLGQGEYNVTAKDFNGCSTGKLFTITSPTDLLISTSKTDITCKGESSGNAEVIVAGGTAPYSIKWFNSANNIVGTELQLSNIAAGIYTVKVSDANGCPAEEKTATVEVLEPQNALMLSIANKSDVRCFGESNGHIALSVSGGWGNYQYSNNDTDWKTSNAFDQLVAGDLNVYVRDRNGCKLSSTININQNPAVGINVSTTDISCFNANNGKIDIAATGGNGIYQYSINNGTTWNNSASFSNLSTGTYQAVTKDGNGCTISGGNVSIGEPTKLELQISNFTALKCFGDADATVELSATGGVSNYQFNKNSGSFVTENTFTNLNAGNYTFNVKDGNGCTASVSQNIVNPAKLSLAVTNSTDVSCYGNNNGSITLSNTGGTPSYSFSINGTSAQSGKTFNNLVAGIYSLKVVDANNCEASVSKVIAQPSSPLALSIASFANVSCYGKNDGRVVLLASGGTTAYNYSINNGTPVSTSTFSGLAVSSGYNFKVEDSKGCTATVSKAIAEPSQLTISTTRKSNPTCFGLSNGAVEVGVSGGASPYTYSWRASSTKQEYQNSKAYASTNSFSGFTAGNYTYKVTDKNGCVAEVSETISNPAKVSLAVTSVTNVTCNGLANGSLIATANGGTSSFQYSIDGTNWQPTGSFSNLSANSNLTVRVKDSNSCTSNVTASITQPSVLNLKLDSYTNVSCKGNNNGSVSLSASGGTSPYQYSNNGSTWGNSSFTNLAPANYNFIVKDSKGCTKNLTQTVTEPNELLIASANVKDPTCFNYPDGKVDATISGGTTPYTYAWSNGSSVATTGSVRSGNYSLLVTDKNNCQKSQQFTLINPEQILPTLPESKIICSNQTLVLDAGYHNLNHQWTSDNGFTSNNSIVTLTRTGNYYLTVTNSKGCFGSDTVNLTTRDIEIEADFLLPDSASVSDTIAAIDISWPLPDSIAWVYPETFSPSKVDPYYVYLIPEEEGDYTISLITYLMGCSETLEKTIVIDPYHENGKDFTNELSIIQKVQTYPNPNNGSFNVAVDLNTDADVTLEIYSIYGTKIKYEKAKGLSHYTFDVNIKQLPGIYLLRVSAGNEYKNYRVIIQ
ncbi:hypothetical protein CYCD_11240 [Tenuifilaceae bacterium CYCD]|nr:hypothetical protein CYCD_11240 [Tenuifilaceae bacterium CYCD]